MNYNDNSRIKNNNEIVEIIKRIDIDPKSPYAPLQQAILITAQKYGADHAMKALYEYMEKGIATGFTRQNSARQNLLANKDILTADTIRQFIDYVENLTFRSTNQTQVQIQTNEQYSNNMNVGNNEHNGVYVVSDFHGEVKALEKTIEKINQGKKVIVLGDATDRGADGLEILQDIMNIQKRVGNCIEYVPGNHDEFLYKALYKGMRTYELTGDIRYLQNYGMEACDTYLQNEISQKNGMVTTYKRLKMLLSRNPQQVYELGRWLEEQPILRMEYDNGKRIALGHATFDVELYKRQYNLRNYVEDQTKNPLLSKKASLCLWYRDTNQENVQSAKLWLVLPTMDEATDIIVGHTPYAGQVNLVGTNGTRTAFCVDGADHKSSNQEWMADWDSRRGTVDVTVFYSEDFPEPNDPYLKAKAREWYKQRVMQRRQNTQWNNSQRGTNANRQNEGIER